MELAGAQQRAAEAQNAGEAGADMQQQRHGCDVTPRGRCSRGFTCASLGTSCGLGRGCRQGEQGAMYTQSRHWVSSSTAIFGMVTVVMLSVLATPTWALANEYCSSFKGTGSCPPCRSAFDLCGPVDGYWNSVDFCVLPDTPGIDTCGPTVTMDMVSASDRSAVAGQLMAFQSGDDYLYLTFRLNCPFALRPGFSSDVPYSLGVYVWNNTDLLGMPQYADGLTLNSGVYTCLTVVVDLRRVCDPGRSMYTSDTPLAQANYNCGCLPGTRPCPPADLSKAELVVLQPAFFTLPSPANCKPAAGTALNKYIAATTDGSGLLQWDATACGPVGTPRPSPNPSHTNKPPSGVRNDQLPNTPPDTSPPLSFPPPTVVVSQPLPPKPSPPRGAFPPPPRLAAETDSPSPPPLPTVQPPNPPPPASSPPPPPPPPPPAVLQSEGPKASPPPSSASSPPPHMPPPPSPQPPQPDAAAAAGSGGGDSFLNSTGIGIIVGCGVIGTAVMCCCCITLYVYCRRSKRDACSDDGDSISGKSALSLGRRCGSGRSDDRSLTNFSFAMLPHSYDKEGSLRDGVAARRDSSGGGSFAGGGPIGALRHGRDMEKGLFPITDGSAGSFSGDSHLSQLSGRPLSSHGDGFSPQVHLEMEHGRGGGSDPRDLLNAHAAAAAAMGAHARQLAAHGGAATNVELQPQRQQQQAPRDRGRGRKFFIFGAGGSSNKSTGTPASAAAIAAAAALPASPAVRSGGSHTSATSGIVTEEVDFLPPALLQQTTSAESVNSLASPGMATVVAETAAGLGYEHTQPLSGRSSLAAAGSLGGGGGQLPAQGSLGLLLQTRASGTLGAAAAGSAASALLSTSSRGDSGAGASPMAGRPSLGASSGSSPLSPAQSLGGLLGGRSSLRSSPSTGTNAGAYPSVLAVQPASSPAATLAATASGGSGCGSIGAANPYPSLFADAGIAAAATSAGGTSAFVPGARRPPPLASIPSFGPLHLPESTFATHAPMNLDESDDEEHGGGSGADGGGSGSLTLLPYGSATASPSLSPSGGIDVHSSSSVSSAVTLFSPSLGRGGSGAVSAGGSGPSLSARGSAGSPRFASAGGEGPSALTPLATGSSRDGGSSILLPAEASPFAGAALQQQLATLSPPHSPPLPSSAKGVTAVATPGDCTFSFNSGSVSSGGTGDAGGRGLLTTAASLRTVGSSVDLRPGSPLHPSRASVINSTFGAAAASIAAAVSTVIRSSGGSPLRSTGSVGCAPGSPPQRLSGASSLVAAPPPPPPHMQPLVGLHGSVLRPPQPLALQPRSSLPAPGSLGPSGSSTPTAAAAHGSSRSGSPMLQTSRSAAAPSSPTRSPLPPAPPLCLSPSSSLRHTGSLAAALPLPSAASLASASSAALGSPSSSRQASLRTTNSVNTSSGGGGSLRSSGSIALGSAAAGSSWGGGNSSVSMDIPAIRRYCGDGGGGDGASLASAAGGCDSGGEDVPLGGLGGDGLAAVYNAVCRLEPGTLFCNKYKIRDSPLLGRHSVVLLAKNVYSKARVAIKFHADRRQFEREKAALRSLSSTYVPALEEPLEGPALAALGLPPALVMEAGRCTLTDWLRGDGGGGSSMGGAGGSSMGGMGLGGGGRQRDLLSLKAALHQILAALVHLHSRRTVHRDIKPANIMWFDDAHRFKLVDLAESATVGEAAPPCCTPLYSPPEQLKAALEGAACAATVTPAADMWAFGVVAFEVLSGSRFFGPSPSLATVLEAVFGHRPLPCEGGEHSALAGVELSQARRLISHLVVRPPAQRWSAATCHRNALFSSGDDTDQRAAKWDSMLSRITEVQQVVATTTAEVRSAQMAFNFTICEPAPPGSAAAAAAAAASGLDRAFSTASSASGLGPNGLDRAASSASTAAGGSPRLRHMDSSRVSRRIAYRPVPMSSDDCIPGEPIFMLLLRRSYQIRVTVAHAKGLKMDIDRIEHLKLTTPDNQVQLLPMRLEAGLRDGTVEFVGDWEPGSSRSRHLQLVTATEGPIQRRVVFVNAELTVHLAGMPQPITVNTMLYVVIERQSLRYSVAKFKLWSSDRWSQAPQWMRDVAKGTMVLVRVAGNVVGV